MKRNDITTLHSKSVAELQKQITELQQQRAKTRLELAAGKLANVRLLSQLADDLARVKTVLRQKELTA